MISLANDRFLLIWIFNVGVLSVSVHLLIVLSKYRYALEILG